VFASEEEAIGAVSQREHLVLPDAERTEIYEQRYQTAFTHLAPALSELHRRIDPAFVGYRL
jgi:hypothetical protein